MSYEKKVFKASIEKMRKELPSDNIIIQIIDLVKDIKWFDIIVVSSNCEDSIYIKLRDERNKEVSKHHKLVHQLMGNKNKANRSIIKNYGYTLSSFLRILRDYDFELKEK